MGKAEFLRNVTVILERQRFSGAGKIFKIPSFLSLFDPFFNDFVETGQHVFSSLYDDIFVILIAFLKHLKNKFPHRKKGFGAFQS
jgi:hypothetical protein